MAQTDDFLIDANLSGTAFREQASSKLTALATSNLGELSPQNPLPGMIWFDTSEDSTHYLKFRNSANSQWCVLCSIVAATNIIKINLSEEQLDEALKTNLTLSQIKKDINLSLSSIQENVSALSAQIGTLPKKFYDKDQCDKTFLRVDAAAKDSEKLGGTPSEGYHKKDSANGSKITAETKNEIDLSLSDNFNITLSEQGILTLINANIGQSGVITIQNASNITGYGVNLKWRDVPKNLSQTETFAYFVVSDKDIRMGRV